MAIVNKCGEQFFAHRSNKTSARNISVAAIEVGVMRLYQTNAGQPSLRVQRNKCKQHCHGSTARLAARLGSQSQRRTARHDAVCWRVGATQIAPAIAHLLVAPACLLQVALQTLLLKLAEDDSSFKSRSFANLLCSSDEGLNSFDSIQIQLYRELSAGDVG